MNHVLSRSFEEEEDDDEIVDLPIQYLTLMGCFSDAGILYG